MKESILWSGYPSWRQFSWLYLMAGLVAWRGWLFWRFGFSGWIGWAVGAVVLLGTAVVIRRWGHYEILSTCLVVRNGYTGREVGRMDFSDVERVEIRQGPIASLFGIGTVIALSSRRPTLRFRGVDDPEGVKRRIEVATRSTVQSAQSHGEVA